MSAVQKRITVDVIRHGEPEGGDILRGRIDPLLTDKGWQQMRRATGLDSDPAHPRTPAWTHVISSPLKRCADFARFVAERQNLAEADIDEAWQEFDYGDWDGMPIEQWRQVAAPQFAAFRDDLSALVPPNGEPWLDFRDRVLAAWQRFQAYPDGSHLLLVTHGGVLRVILPFVLGMPLNASFPLHIPFASFSRLHLRLSEQGAQASLLFHNAADYELPASDDRSGQ